MGCGASRTSVTPLEETQKKNTRVCTEVCGRSGSSASPFVGEQYTDSSEESVNDGLSSFEDYDLGLESDDEAYAEKFPQHADVSALVQKIR